MPIASLLLLAALNLQTSPSQPTVPPKNATTTLLKTDTKVGTGPEAQPGDVVEMEYVGTLMDGKEFDRSKGTPFRFQIGIGKVIQGWDQGIPGMKAGGERELVIPAALAYGASSPGAGIPANSDLRFTVKLLKIAERAKIETLKAGQGEPVKAGDAVEFHYKGTLPDGKVFDSSYDRGQPLQIEMRSLIPGMNQGLIGMRPGEKRRVTIPAALAYGATGVPAQDALDASGKLIQAQGSLIPGGSPIVFEIELLRVLKKGGQ